MHPGARRRSAWLRRLVLAYAACIVLIEISRRLGPERWWLTCLDLYLPQGAWALPGAILLLLSVARDRRFVLVPALCLAWVLGPIMGFCFAVVRPGAPPEGRFRVMTYNVKYARGDTRALTKAVLAADPDLLLIQDVSYRLTAYPPFATFLRTRYVVAEGYYLVASRYPLSPVEYRPMGSDWYIRTRIESASFPLAVYNVHLLTPRDGLEAMRERSSDGLSELMDGARERLAQVAQLNADLDREVGPVLLAGDLNAPPESLVLRQMRSNRLKDAFSEAGRGYGYTYGHSLKPYVSYMRIDHILFSRELVALDSWVGDRPGSAHRPVVADLARAGT